MDKVSVGATVTIMSAATLAEGTTIIENAAREPEIRGYRELPGRAGGESAGRAQTVSPSKALNVWVVVCIAYCQIVSKPVLAGSAAISGGKIVCRNAQPDTLDAVLAKLRDAGADIEIGEDWISLDMHGQRPKAVNVRTTAPHPAFPTDMQAQFTLLAQWPKAQASSRKYLRKPF